MRPPLNAGDHRRTDAAPPPQPVSANRRFAVLLLDPAGRVESWTADAERLTGCTAHELRGQQLASLYRLTDTDGAPSERALDCARVFGTYDGEGTLACNHGSTLHVRLIISALCSGDGMLRGFAALARDLPSGALAEHARDSEERFRLLVEGVVDYAIFLLDPQGRVSSWNAGAKRIKGYEAREILGQHFSRFYPPDAAARRFPDYELEVARAEGRFENEGWRVRKDGSRFWANVVITALYDENGDLRGFSKITRDLTERRRSEQQLRGAHAALEVRVRERTAELALANAALETENDARRQVEQQLREKLEELRRADEQKDAFIATLAHELRNPLAPIANAIQFLMLSGAPDPRLAKARRIIERQVHHLTRLVDDLLDLSRVTHGRLDLRTQWIELRSVVQMAEETAQPLIAARRHTLTIDLPAAPILMQLDPTRIAQVLSNLIHNAAKFTPPGGQITVTARRADAGVIISVRDTGIGIPSDQLLAIFEMFTQLENRFEKSAAGLGIGLTLVRRLVELHGGSITAHSDGIGQGSEFVLRLPIDAKRPTASASELEHSLALLQEHRVLIVDDNRDSADSMSLALSAMGAETRTAYDGDEALRVGDAFAPDTVLMDIGMPRMNGLEAARHIRGRAWGKQALLIAMTGWGHEDDRTLSAAAGFDYHLTKPIDPHALTPLLARNAS